MQSKAASVADYLKELPEDRRAVMTKVRALLRKHLPKGLAETMQYGMISYVVPHKLYPAGYHCNPADGLPFVSVAAQKNNYSLYLMTVYMVPGMEAWMREQFQAAGKKLDMGKSCIRFKKLEDLPLETIGAAVGKVSIADYIQMYEDGLKAAKARKKK